MNPTTDEQLPPPPQPPQPHRSSTSCDRHPDEHFTGFCPCCLCERLAVLDKSAASATATTGRKSASAAIRSLFKASDGGGGGVLLRGRPSSSSFLPELRRTKSFSGGKNEGSFSGAFEPQRRRSCDVRGRSTLFSLFSQDDVTRPHHHRNGNNDGPTASTVAIKSNENVEEEEEEEEERFHDSNGDEIQEVREEEEEEEEEEERGGGGEISIVEERDSAMSDLKTMKDYIDLDSQNNNNNNKGSSSSAKDLKELAGSFWSAASVFSKKLRAWTKTHKVKKYTGSQTHVHLSSNKGNAGKRNKYNYRDTQSEIADYGYGRRSCDTDPRLSFDVGRFSVDAGRFSVDAGRISLDDPRYSFDEPRASWDGYLMGRGTGFTRMVPPPSMLSVVEDAPAHAPLPVVPRKDAHIPVEEPRRSSVSTVGEDCIPGCASQTKDYYSDSSSRRRKSLDRSSSIRKTAAAVVADLDEIKSNNNSNASISNNVDPREVNLNSNSLRVRDDCSESFDLGFRDNASSVIGGGERKEQKKSKRWKAIGSIWGLLYRRGNAKDIDDDDQQYSVRANGVQRSLSESWPELRRDGGGYGGNIGNRTVFRSNSSVSWRNSYNVGGSSYNHGVRKKKEDPPFVLERNRSSRYSPGHAADNGMLRFYLTPMRGSRKGGGSGKPKPAYSHSFARSVLRLY